MICLYCFIQPACESVVASELSLKNNKRGVEAEQESVDFRSTKFSNSGSTTYQLCSHESVL